MGDGGWEEEKKSKGKSARNHARTDQPHTTTTTEEDGERKE